jgi:hypothetical protein
LLYFLLDTFCARLLEEALRDGWVPAPRSFLLLLLLLCGISWLAEPLHIERQHAVV